MLEPLKNLVKCERKLREYLQKNRINTHFIKILKELCRLQGQERLKVNQQPLFKN